jgi:hypothetical protein
VESVATILEALNWHLPSCAVYCKRVSGVIVENGSQNPNTPENKIKKNVPDNPPRSRCRASGCNLPMPQRIVAGAVQNIAIDIFERSADFVPNARAGCPPLQPRFSSSQLQSTRFCSERLRSCPLARNHALSVAPARGTEEPVFAVVRSNQMACMFVSRNILPLVTTNNSTSGREGPAGTALPLVLHWSNGAGRTPVASGAVDEITCCSGHQNELPRRTPS